MQIIVKFFPEITIKSKPVRKRFVTCLRSNIRKLLIDAVPDLEIRRDWDKLVLLSVSATAEQRALAVDILSRIPGIANFLEVEPRPWVDMHTLFEQVRDQVGDSLKGKTFAVRCKRVGEHDFTSSDVERYVGGGLNQHLNTGGVKLKNPDETIRIEIRYDEVFLVTAMHPGLGGYPLGEVEPCMSLLSGGFDSTVASYLTLKRGMMTHFCFFNLGGRDHEIAVREVALFLWQRYGASHRVKFVSVPFEPVVAEILQNTPNAMMGVVLKRMMLRAASALAEQLEVRALVTGESVAQVSSQTVTNLSVIDRVTETLVLRPLVTTDKTAIIDTCRDIGAEAMVAAIPEYCGVISVKPATRASVERVEAAEKRFDFSVLEKAIADTRMINIDELADDPLEAVEVEVLPAPVAGATVLDVRHPLEADRTPLNLEAVEVKMLPFYELHSRFAGLPQDRVYMLYCDKGVMSRLHAAHLVSEGFANVKVYRPSPA